MVTATSLDIEQPQALIAYLREAGHIGPDERLDINPLSGGVSNRAVLVKRPSGEAWVLKQALPKLRVAVDWFSSPERVHREALGLRWLGELAPPGSLPGFVFEDFEHHILAMQAVPEPHANWKQLLLAGQLDPDHVWQFGRLLGAIHHRAFERLDEIRADFEDRSFFESLRLEPYYAYTASQVPASADFYRALMVETRATRLTLVHGDYSPKNILVYQDRLVLLDHEVVHFGDPAFDLGFSMTHLLSKAHHLRPSRQAFTDAARGYWNAYLEGLGSPGWAAALQERAVRHTLGCLLARVDGRSPLEYLTPAEKAAQRVVVVALMQEPPQNIPDLIDRFIVRLP